ncbi:hypothetical protein [Streptomyces alkaliphilus]|uniref:hypothetical protein n=1 Tax=Streptomyces alkaliphilus TaxID=1472722 RepID=UPI00117FA1FB|nr:hypothetical protein [Streptomyces alkaliphilus]MQS07340.1 hypothetical protein [Streptomyces alkaliphilus]
MFAEALFSIHPQVDEVRDVWERTMRHGRLLISDTLPRLAHLTPTRQDESRAVTHHRRQDEQLGERREWTRAASRPALPRALSSGGPEPRGTEIT